MIGYIVPQGTIMQIEQKVTPGVQVAENPAKGKCQISTGNVDQAFRITLWDVGGIAYTSLQFVGHSDSMSNFMPHFMNE